MLSLNPYHRYQTMRLSLHRPTGYLCLVIACLWCDPSPLHAQNAALIPVRKPSRATELKTETNAWALHLKPHAVIQSPLVRLRDISTPVHANASWWTRAGDCIVAMTSMDEQEMVIERARLEAALARLQSLPAIQWSGAEQVTVVLRREQVSAAPTGQAEPVASTDRTIANTTPSPGGQSTSEAASEASTVTATAPMTPTELNRVLSLLQIAVDRYDTQLRTSFDVVIDPSQLALQSLANLRRVDSLTWEEPPGSGSRIATVQGMSARAPVTAQIEYQFQARPLVVAAKESLKRGQVLSESDLYLTPAPRNLKTQEALTEISDAIGLQVQSVITSGSPVMRAALAPMTLVERGDLVEVQVVGGGIVVATGAKTLAAGAQGDLIPIETLDPRRKLMARVTGHGLVEIVTRPPRVR